MEGNALGTAITTVTSWFNSAIDLFTSEPLVYFLAIGLISGVIGLFARSKRAAR